jgi:glycosyltransferase involved in cell wall biosynthesis
MAKISVIIVTYNRMNDLLFCIKSIFDSTFKDIEIIIVDNASTDNTIETL